MRALSLLICLLVLVACGKDSSSGGGGQNAPQRQEETITFDGMGIDLLDTTIDVRSRVTPSDITFLESKNSEAQGRRVECQSQVRSGEVYNLALNGNTLDVQTPSERFTMERLNDSNTDVYGSWSWIGMSKGVHMIRVLTIVNESRVILKTHCEF